MSDISTIAEPENCEPSNSPSRQYSDADCVGVTPLTARLEPWMNNALNSEAVSELVETFGSPVNLISIDPFERNIDELRQVAAKRDVDFEVYFARKANKCLAFVESAKTIGCGIDVASDVELQQVLNAGFDTKKVICTAAIKTREMLKRCIKNKVTIAVDNRDELEQVEKITSIINGRPCIALRVSGFDLPQAESAHGAKVSRFGFDIGEVRDLVAGSADFPTITGIHFHLDGYCAAERIIAIRSCLSLIDDLRQMGHEIEFLDIGGGIPISYLNAEDQWTRFWHQHEEALLGDRPPLTYRNHGLGLFEVDGRIHGKRKSYPFFQTLTRANWLAEVLDAESSGGKSIAAAIVQRDLQLRCEPGRSVLDGCGMTAARVGFRKRHRDGHWLIGLAMNRTQCRTSSDDFLVDPLLIRSNLRSTAAEATSMEGFLVGAYCTESELLSLRKLIFPSGVNVGDLIVFPNTAGYLMHFLESRSHQFPLAKNIVLQSDESYSLDAIDC